MILVSPKERRPAWEMRSRRSPWQTDMADSREPYRQKGRSYDAYDSPRSKHRRHGIFPCRLLRTSHRPFHLRKEEAGREDCTVLYRVRRFLRDGADAIHRIVFRLAGEALTGSVILYAVYGGLMAALFEETGRYIAMRFLVKPMDFPNAFMYGAGHGGVEAMLLCGVASISNIASAVMINSGTMSAQLASLDAKKAADTAAALSALWTTPSLTFFAGGVERLLAVVLHVSLSILVFQSIRKKAPMELVRAYLFHFVIDSLSVLLSAVASVWVVELVAALVTGGAVLMARYACMEE